MNDFFSNLIDCAIPLEYSINSQIKDKLSPIDISRYQDDTVFYLFYMNSSDLIQLQAAHTLYERGIFFIKKVAEFHLFSYQSIFFELKRLAISHGKKDMANKSTRYGSVAKNATIRKRILYRF